MEDKDKKRKGLEAAIKDKVIPLIGKSMEKHWGLKIPKIEEDISDRLSQSTVDSFIHFNLSFEDAKKKFKADFLRRELIRHRGNISQLAKYLGINRRSIHRAIKELDLEVDRLEIKSYSLQIEHEKYVDNIIRSSFDQYKGLINEEKIERIYQDIPKLSKNIAFSIPDEEMTWKEAELAFEKEYFKYHLKTNKETTKQLAERVGLRPETVCRKLKKLGLNK